MKSGVRTIILLLGDIAALTAAFFTMLGIGFAQDINENIIRLHAVPFAVIGFSWLIIFFIFNLYNTKATRLNIQHLRQTIIAFIVAFAVAAIFFYTVSSLQIAPKTNLIIFTVSALVSFIIWRRIFYTIFSRYFRKSVVFIVSDENNTPQVEDLKQYIASYPQSGFLVAGVFENFAQFESLNIKDKQHIFIVSKDIWKDADTFKKLYTRESEVMDLASAYEDILGKIPVEAIDESWFIHNIGSDKDNMREFIKRSTSRLAAIFFLIIVSPLLLVIAMMIKLSDRGPILYSQLRVGKNGQNFKLYKFRSMVLDAEKDGPQWSNKDDSRVTLFGNMLRKTHLDEIPQMLNVAKGDLALVGPRPERPEFVEDLENKIPYYHLRHIITPGFTGWAQIKFRYANTVLDSKEKFEYDLYYLKNRNIFMDFGILIRTIQIIFTH